MKNSGLLRYLLMVVLVGAFICPVGWSQPRQLEVYQTTLKTVSTSEPESILQGGDKVYSEPSSRW